MKGPVCVESPLVMTERQGIEIDYCPQCRDVWLDRGELDKIIERTDRASGPSQPASAAYSQRQDCRNAAHDSSRNRHYRGRGGFLKDLFD